jgi:hypothetical protein
MLCAMRARDTNLGVATDVELAVTRVDLVTRIGADLDPNHNGSNSRDRQ